MLGRAIAFAAGIAFQIMLCLKAASADEQVYSAGELLAPIYFCSVAVALSLLGQSCEYYEDYSTVGF